MLSVEFRDQVAFLKSRRFRRGPFLHNGHSGRVIPHHAGDDHGADKGHDKVKHRTCRHHGDSGPHRGIVKGTCAVVIVILTYHQAGTADGKQLQGISGAALLCGNQPRSHTQ